MCGDVKYRLGERSRSDARIAFPPYGLLFVHQEVVQVARDVDSTAPLHEPNFVGVLTVRYLQCMCEAPNQTTAATTMIA